VTLVRGARAGDPPLTVGDEEVLAFDTGAPVGWMIDG